MFGKLIFIKKTGGDGSKFPVMEKKISIGRSEECLIRIHNPQVAQQHCYLIADDSGQVKLKNLSNNTNLNGKTLNVGEVVLHHGDIFKVGDRLVRWEYVPTSKYYQKVLPSPGKLVAVVMPQQRSAVSSASSTSRTLSKHSFQGIKKRYTEKSVSELNQPNKILNFNSTRKFRNSMSDLQLKMQTAYNFQSTTDLFNSKIENNKSVSEINEIGPTSPKTRSLEKSNLSASPAWKLKIATQSSSEESVIRKSTPIKINTRIEKYGKLQSQSGLLNAIIERSPKEGNRDRKSSLRNLESPLSERKNIARFEATPKAKMFFKTERLVKSERKQKRERVPLPATTAKINRFSLALKPVGKMPRINLLKNYATKSRSSPFKRISGAPAKRKLDLKSTPNSAIILRNSEVSIPIQEAPSSTKSRKSSKSLTKSRNSNSNRVSLETSNTLAEKAAQRLKITNPRKPDKNKKAALLVLGKAVRKQPVSQNIETLLKKKIVKKAIKQSAAPVGKRKTKHLAREGKKRPQENKVNRKSSVNALESSTPFKSISDKGKSDTKLNSANESFKNLKSLTSSSATTKLSIEMAEITPDQFFLSKIQDKYLFGSNRRSSKRLSSKNDVDKPDYLELSPTALGLIPKNLDEIFKSPGPKNKRRSISLVTPKSNSSFGTIRSASTTKRVNRKSVRFSSKDLPARPSFLENYADNGTPFKFESVETPNISLDVFVSPLSESISVGSSFRDSGSTRKKSLIKEVKSSAGKENQKKYPGSDNRKTKCTRKLLQSPDFKCLMPEPLSVKRTADEQSPIGSSKRLKITTDQQYSSPKLEVGDMRKSMENSFTSNKDSLLTTTIFLKKFDVKSAEKEKILTRSPKKTVIDSKKTREFPRMMVSPKKASSPKQSNSLIKASQSLEKVVTLAKALKSPKQSNSFKKMFESPEMASPKKALISLKQPENTKKMIKPTKAVASPKKAPFEPVIIPKSSSIFPNQLTYSKKKPSSYKADNLNRVLHQPEKLVTPKRKLQYLNKSATPKKLILSPKRTFNSRSPKKTAFPNRMVQTRKELKAKSESPKVVSRTPRIQRSSRNDLSKVSDVKKLIKTPLNQKSPKNEKINDNLRGVKRLLTTSKGHKGPINELWDLRGVKTLFSSPKIQKSPKNDLTNPVGIRLLFKNPRIQRSPKNDLTDLRGVKKLLGSPKIQRSPKNDLSDLRGVKKLLGSPKVQKSPKNDLSDLRGVRKLLTTPRNLKSPKNDLTDVEGVKELYKIQSNSDGKSPKTPKAIKQLLTVDNCTKDSNIESVKIIKGKRTTHSSARSPKNDLTNVEGIRELFTRNKSVDSINESLTGVAHLFDLSARHSPNSPRGRSKSLRIRALSRTRKSINNTVENIIQKSTRRKRLSTDVTESSKKAVKRSKNEVSAEVKRVAAKKGVRRVGDKTVEKDGGSLSAESNQRRTRGRKTNIESTDSGKVVKEKRSRKIASEPELSPPKLRKKLTEPKKTAAARKSSSVKITKAKAETTKKKTSVAGSRKNMGENSNSRQTKSKAKASSEKKSKVMADKSKKRTKEKGTAVSLKISPRKTRSRTTKKTDAK